MSRALIVLIAAVASPLLVAPAHSRPLGRAMLDPSLFETGSSSLGPAIRSGASLSGTTLAKSQTTTTWLLYPDACADAANGTWSPRSTAEADSLDSYAVGSTGPYQVVDRSASEVLWGIADAATPASERPPIINGSRSLWCGKYDPNWLVPVGYPNLTYQILYMDTGTHAGDYTLSFTHNFSSEWGYDYIHLIGGGDGAQDPIGNDQLTLDDIIESVSVGNKKLLVAWNGSIEAGDSYDTTGGPVDIQGHGSHEPQTAASSFTIEAQHRALYLVFTSDCLFSQEDGLWYLGSGQVLDLLQTSDNGVLYDDQTASGGEDEFGGAVLIGTPAAPVLSARVPPGVGAFWQIMSGASVPTASGCSPEKSLASDHFFYGGDPVTFSTVPGVISSVVGCALPVPPGTGSLLAYWSVYVDLPFGTGVFGQVEYRVFDDGNWRPWESVLPGAVTIGGGLKRWIDDGAELVRAVQADSVQIRWGQYCAPFASVSGDGCQPTVIGLLFDNFRLEAVSGTPKPVFLRTDNAQTTFIDGTMTGTECSTIPCWPDSTRYDDNFNFPFSDVILQTISTGLRANGMGINWREGRHLVTGEPVTNASFNPAHDTPRMIYRLYDPVQGIWSPFDSTSLEPEVVMTASDTIVVFEDFATDWPPRDKLETAASLPGGFTIGGFTYGAPVRSAYSDLSFLPRGARLQYYFKAVDINGGVTYDFTPGAYEVEDLPILPGGVSRAPDILEFEVLPRVYPPGPPGSLLAGRRDTPILNLDGSYGAWSFGQDPVTQALKGLGVRADRYRGPFIFSEVGGADRWPKAEDYGIKDSLATWYRIIIQSSNRRINPIISDLSASLLRDWWSAPTGTHGGDRCLFASGDDFFYSMTLSPLGGGVNQLNLMLNVFGVASVANAWSGSTATPYPSIDDRFAAPGSGPTLAAPGAFTYPVDGGCIPSSRLNPGRTSFDAARSGKFDALTKTGSSDAQYVATYPLDGGTAQGAAISVMSEQDPLADFDRSKTLAYGFSFQFIRQPGLPTNTSTYDHSGVENRMRVLYKFLTGCRGQRTQGQSAQCWPCPTDNNMTGDWAALAGFQTETYGPLYPIQDPTLATGVAEPGPGIVPLANALSQNRPNPFNPETVIPYTLAATGRVTLRIYDVSGRLVRTLVNRRETAGPHEVKWRGETNTGTRAASGIYFYRITYPDGSFSARRMAILK